MSQLEHKETLRLVDMAPPWWFKRAEGSSIWVTGYSVLRVPKETFTSGPKIIDLSEVRAVLLHGTLKYIDSSQAKIEAIADNRWHVDASKVHEQATPEGVYMLFLAPFAVDGREGNEALTRQKISIAAGLFATFNGRNIVYQRLFDNIIEMGVARTHAFGPVFENPLCFALPDVSDSRLKAFSEADKAVAALREPSRNRIHLSLCWFESALYDSGVDAYLKYWIALETLAMPDTTNIRPLNESLSQAYNLLDKASPDRFAIGRLHGLRGRIVHEGQLVPIHGNLLRYLEALYVDILFVHLRLPCERRAASVLDDPEFTLKKYLHEPR